MLRISIGIFMLLHGLVHLWYFVMSRGLVELKPEMGWSGKSWLLTNLLGWDHIAIESLFSPATPGANRSTPMQGVHLGNWPGLHRNTNF